MNKEDIDFLAKYLTDMKDSLGELESAMKKKDSARINAARAKITLLQSQIDRKI